LKLLKPCCPLNDTAMALLPTSSTSLSLTSMGVHGKFGKRNAPTVIDALFNIVQFWDGREPTLEDQARDPIVNPIEMGMPNHDTVVKKLASITDYNNEFQQVFGGPPTYDNMVEAIAVYERTQLAFDCIPPESGRAISIFAPAMQPVRA